MTVSFHKYNGDFFRQQATGRQRGWSGGNTSVSMCRCRRDDDDSYLTLFKAVMEPTITSYRPAAIVLQCARTRSVVTVWEHSIFRYPLHGECVRFIKAYGLPLLVWVAAAIRSAMSLGVGHMKLVSFWKPHYLNNFLRRHSTIFTPQTMDYIPNWTPKLQI